MLAERLARRRHVVMHLAADPRGQARFVGQTGIALMTVGAILALRGSPSTAEYGWAGIFFYVVGAIPFFVPLSLGAAERATGWPGVGGNVCVDEGGVRAPRVSSCWSESTTDDWCWPPGSSQADCSRSVGRCQLESLRSHVR